MMQRLIQVWEKSFYTELLLILVLCLALMVSIRQRKKYEILKWLPIYIFTLLLVYTSRAFFDRKQYPFLSKLGEYLDYAFTILEIVVFSIFYYQLIDSLIVKRLIIFLNIAFCLFSFYMFFTEQGFYQTISQGIQSMVYTVEGIILLAMSLYYFKELFRKPPDLNLKNDPVFWISTGALFFFACTLPYSWVENFIGRNYFELYDAFYSIFYIFYILLFIMIIRAYLCKPGKTI